MRPALWIIGGIIVIATSGVARAATCVDTTQNNAAFSSTYVTGETPCQPQPKPAAKPVRPAEQRAARENLKAKPVVAASDKPHVVPTEHGTLIRSGETTVCISGSVSVDVHGGSGHTGGLGRNSPAPGCY